MADVQSGRMARGLRKPPNIELKADEIEVLIADISTIGADISIFEFNSEFDIGTSYFADIDIIRVKGNVLPDLTSDHPRDKMSPRAVLAHEYYGHRPYRNQYLWEDSQTSPEIVSKINALRWIDEFRASYTAAKITPNLSDEDRYYLVLDSLKRAEEAGVSIKYNNFIRGILYGYENN